MIVYTLGSDSGFGLGTNGIVDDYDDETGISVILWCIIFLFLLIVTIWFYISQLMPARNAKCEVDDDAEDEDERVANRLLDQLGTRTLDKSNDEPSTCEPSTSREDDYEVIDGEIRIHYTSYVREPIDDDNNDTPQETRTSIPRRPSMEEMSLIFPGFLPSISEEEEEYEETCNEENVCQSGSDNVESNVNIFIEHESSNEHNKSQTDHKLHQEKENQLETSTDISRVVTNRKGKQPIGYVSTEIRRRHIQKDFTDIKIEEIKTNDSTPLKKSGLNGSYVRDSELETAVIEPTSTIKNTHQHEQNAEKFHNKTKDNFIAGDPINQTSTSGPKHDLNTLIIIDESTVALETLSQDANENTNLNTTDRGTPTISNSFTAKIATEELPSEEKLNDIEEKVECEKRDVCESPSGHVDIVSSSDKKLKSSSIMEDQLTHSWTFYAMSDTNSNIENYLQYFERTKDQQDIPQIVVDVCSDEKERNGKTVEHSYNNAVDAFETDIDVDDIDLDELDNDDNAESDDLNCFVKRHVSVTDLDKILTSHDIGDDTGEQYRDDLYNERDLDELVRDVTEPIHKTNNDTTKELPKATGDCKIVNKSKQNSVPKGNLMYSSYSTMISDQVSIGEDFASKECGVFNTQTSKQNVPRANKEQHSTRNDNGGTVGKTAVHSEVKFGGYSKRDIENRDIDEKQLEKITHVENYINALNKDTNDNNTTIHETSSIDTITNQRNRKATKGELNADNVPDLTEHHTIREQEANQRNSSSTDSPLVTVTNIKEKPLSCSIAKDTEIITDRREAIGRVSTERSSTRRDNYVGLTAEELRSKVDLSKPVYTSSREVIIGRKKSRKDNATKLFTSVTPDNKTELSRKSSETVRSKNETSRTASKISRSKSEPSRSAVEQAVASRNAFETSRNNSELSRYSSRLSHSTSQQIVTSRSISEKSFVTRRTTEQTTSCNSVETIPTGQIKESTIISRVPAEQVDRQTNAGVHVREIPVTQSSDVKQLEAKNGMDSSGDSTRTKNNSVNWTTKLAKTRELQTLISINNIPDSNVGLQISTTTPIDTAKTRKASTGLEKAEAIVSNRMKRLEKEKKDGKVQENVTPITSQSRQIDWDSFLVDGLALKRVDNTREKTKNALHNDIVLTPPLARKPIVKDNGVQVCESYTPLMLNPRELDWDWFECEEKSAKVDNKNSSQSNAVHDKDNYTHEKNNNITRETDSFERNNCAKHDHNAGKNENKDNCELDNNEDVVVVTDCVKDKDEHYRNDIGVTGVNVNDPTTLNDNQEKLSTKHGSLSDDNDVFSHPSYPSSEPEFPVRLSKSFSELRNVEMLNQSQVAGSSFQRPDRSKSQTDVFTPQGSQDDVFNDSEGHVFQTKITVDEVYKNRRRIVILNVRKKSPGKTRWKSLSDLESAKRHVFRFSSIGSHSELDEEKLSAGDGVALFSENKDSDFTLSDKVPISLSRDCNHSNDANEAGTPYCKQAENPIMESTVENYDLIQRSRPIELDLQESSFKTIEQRFQEEDLPSGLTNDVDVASTPLSYDSTQLETVNPKLCESVESQGNVFQDDFISTKVNPAPCYRVSSPAESEVEISQLQQQTPPSPVKKHIRQTTENSRRSPGTMFAVSRYSPTPLTDMEVENSLRRLTSPPTIVPDIVRQDGRSGTSSPLSRTVNTVNEKTKDLSNDQQQKSMYDSVTDSSESVKDLEIETTPKLPDSKRNKQDYSPCSQSEMLSTISKARPTPLEAPTDEKHLQRQSSLSPVNDITVRRSPSPLGTIFAVRGQSPSPLKEYKDKKHTSRQSSLSPNKDQDNKISNYGKTFALSRHSPTPLSDAEQKISDKITTSSPLQFVESVPELHRNDYDTSISMTRRRVAADTQTNDISTDNKSKESDTVALTTRPSISNDRSQDEKYKRERLSQQSSSILPGITDTSQDYISRTSSASSSGYGGSRISPSSSLERRYTYEKPCKPSLSPDLVCEGKRDSSSRRSSASSGSVFLSRLSPTPSTDSELSNMADRRSSLRQRSQRGSYRSGTVFAVSGYSSAGSDSESKRSGSNSPRDNDQKYAAKLTTRDKDSKEQHNTSDQPSNYKEITPCEIRGFEEGSKEYSVLATREKLEEQHIASSVQTTEVKHSIFNRLPSTESDYDFQITQDGWLVRANTSFPRTSDQTFRAQSQQAETDDRVKRTNDRGTDDLPSRANDILSGIPERKVRVTDLDFLLNGPGTATTKRVIPDEQADVQEKEPQSEVIDVPKARPATVVSPTGVQETSLDDIFESDSSSSKEDKETQIPKMNATQPNKIVITSVITSEDRHTVRTTQQDFADCNSTPSPMLDDLDEDIFTRITPKPRRDPNDMTFSSDADSETSSLNSFTAKSKVKHTKSSLEAAKPPPHKLSQSSESSCATPSTPEKVEPQFMFVHPDLTSTPEVMKSTEITKYYTSMTREATKEPRHGKRQDSNVKGNSVLTDSSYGAVQVKTRSTSDSRVISTETSKSAFTPVRSRTNDRRSISQEYILDGLAMQEEGTPNYNAIEQSAFKDLADSHKSMPDLHKAQDDDEIVGSPKKTVPYHSRLSAHTRLWLSQTAGIDTSDLCKDESGGSEIFLFPSKRFQPGKNVDASFLSIASEGDDIPDDVSSRASSPMSEFSFAGDSPFGAEGDNELRIIACGHRYCDQEEIIRGQEKTSFTSCPACYTYYCSRECRQAHWREHKKFCYFGRINSYMRSFIYFCHKKDNLRLLLSNMAIRNYASKGRGSVMVTFASPKQARKFMTSGCVLLPSPPSYSTVRELMQEGIVSKHKVNLVHQVKDYDPTKEFVLNLAVVAGKLEDLPRHPVPRHKLNTVLECIKVPLSESVIQQPKNTVPDTSKETRVFYLPKCSRHGFINDMEARRHYCRNISKSLKSFGIRLKKDYPEAYECLCLYVEKNKPFKPMTVYGNEGSKIITCKIMPEASISAV